MAALLGVLAEVLLVNLLLSGDNAVVIGLATRGLPAKARQRAVVLGGGFAVALRLLVTVPAEFLLNVPFLRAGGGLLLVWVAYRLLTGEEESMDDVKAATIATAVRLIVLADLTMSLDNILAVAAVAERSSQPVTVLIVGLALSIPIVLLGGSIVARLMGRLPLLVWAGAAILGYTAGELITGDDALTVAFRDHYTVKIGLSFAVAVATISVAALRLRVRRDTSTPPFDQRISESKG